MNAADDESTAPAFKGPESLRARGERATLIWTVVSLPLTIVVLGWVFQHQFSWQQIALLIVVSMIYVSFTRGRLLGGGLRVHAGQFGHVFDVVEECARMLQMPTPHVFVRDDPFVPVVGIGTGDPYAIVISAQYVEYFKPDELRFLIGRELGHIAAGHTRFTSLLSSNGRENGVISVAFGAWLRKIDYTADRVGLLCCGSLDAALRAIAVSSFHAAGRHIDLGAFAEQLNELKAEPSLRMGEWTASTPYATNRIAALHTFARDPLYQLWSRRFAANVARTRAVAEPLRDTGFVGFWRRAAAFAIDVTVIQVIWPAADKLAGASAKLDPDDVQNVHAMNADPHVPSAVKDIVNSAVGPLPAASPLPAHATAVTPHFVYSSGFDPGSFIYPVFLVYVVLLVALMGQTFGMMVADVRVVRSDRSARVGFGGAIARYLAFFASCVGLVGLWSIFRRVQPFEKWSNTRLVSNSATVRT
jgi:Zn-dependent protease with chaperone function